MEVDRLQKGKDKGKGKTKDVKGSKGKGKEEKGKSKGKGGKFQSGPEAEGKGKSGKEKGKGKGTSEVCWTCDRSGHLAKDCWRARQVEAPASNVPSSPPTVSPSTTASVQPSETTLKAVRRVSQPLIFDLRQAEGDSGAIRVLQMGNEGESKAAVAFYSIATDDEEDNENILKVKAVHEIPPEECFYGEGEKVVKASIIVDSGADASLFLRMLRAPMRTEMWTSSFSQRMKGGWCLESESPLVMWCLNLFCHSAIS